MRLIDEDALVDALMIYTWRDEDERTIDDADEKREYIKGWLPNVPTVCGWISVKDRLPKSMANKVLVWLEHEDLRGYIGYGHYEKFHGEEMWYDLEHGERFDKRGYIVTHWMPLPEPPKDGEVE